METIDTLDTQPFKNLVMSIGALPSSFVDSMSYYEALAWLVNYLQTQVIPAVNNNAEALTELQAAFVTLKDYVDHYFDNLDVQEEIDHKLDEMVESGEFQEIVGQLLVEKYDYYTITDQTQAEVQAIFDVARPKVIAFANDYTFTSTRTLNANTKILLNNHTITFNIPSVNDDSDASHGFFNFEPTDETLEYNGNGNIEIIGGKIVGGNLSFAHASNIVVKNVEFEHCKNNHILEMCAIENLNVENCIFNGIPAGATGEYVQIERATATAFPWYSEGSTSYDNTPCKNIIVNGCDFNKPSNAGYIHDCSFGGHETGTYAHKDIQITNCNFTNEARMAFQLYNSENVVIRNCNFKSNTESEESCHIRFRSGIKNAEISNCTFNGCMRAIQGATDPNFYDNVVISNCYFYGYKNTTYANHAIIETYDPTYIKIVDCTFEDYLQRVIKSVKSASYDSDTKHEMIIQGNTFIPKNNITDDQSIQLQCGDNYFIDNIIDGTGTTTNKKFLEAKATANSLFAKGNTFSVNMAEGRYDISDLSPTLYSNVYGVYCTAWEGNSSSQTISSSGYTFANFNTMYASFGGGGSTCVIKIRAFDQFKKLDTRTWKAAITDGTTVSSASFALTTTNNTLVYAGSINLRNVRLVNE